MVAIDLLAMHLSRSTTIYSRIAMRTKEDVGLSCESTIQAPRYNWPLTLGKYPRVVHHPRLCEFDRSVLRWIQLRDDPTKPDNPWGHPFECTVFAPQQITSIFHQAPLSCTTDATAEPTSFPRLRSPSITSILSPSGASWLILCFPPRL